MILLQSASSRSSDLIAYYTLGFFIVVIIIAISILILKWIIKSSIKESFKEMEVDKNKNMIEKS